MIKKDKKLEFVKSRSRRKYKKENDHINKETSKTESEDSSKFLHDFRVGKCGRKISNLLKVQSSTSFTCFMFSRWSNSFSE